MTTHSVAAKKFRIQIQRAARVATTAASRRVIGFPVLNGLIRNSMFSPLL